MKEWLIAITEPTIVVIDAIALVIVAYGTLEALFKIELIFVGILHAINIKISNE